MWTVLSSRRNTSSTAVGRQAIYRQFCSLHPTPGEQIGDYFAKLLELQNQISGTPEAISDVVFKTHVFASLPAAFEVTAKIQQNRPNATIKSILDSLKEDESIRGMCVQPDASTEAFFSHTNSSNHQRGRGLGRFNFLNHPNQKGQWCTFCNTLTHNRANCRSKQFATGAKRHQEDTTAASEETGPICWYCAENGHRISKCPIKRRGDEACAKGLKRQRVKANLGEKKAGSSF